MEEKESTKTKNETKNDNASLKPVATTKSRTNSTTTTTPITKTTKIAMSEATTKNRKTMKKGGTGVTLKKSSGNTTEGKGSTKPKGKDTRKEKPSKPKSSKPKHQTTTKHSSDVSSNKNGNDRVTVDNRNQPLVAKNDGPSGLAKKASKKPPPTTPTTTGKLSTSKIPPLKGEQSQGGAGPGPSLKSVSNLKAPPPPPPPPTPPEPPAEPDEQTLFEEAIKKERAPLVDKYEPFIIPSDTTLEDARNRLRIALEQTRQLRTAFTDRVYNKYRVCLMPPASMEDTLTQILSDPGTVHTQLSAQILESKDEKEIEKKEANKLNAEVLAVNNVADAAETSSDKTPNPTTIMNAENAEQLMYISAGLSAIVLPEQDVVKDGIDVSCYEMRGPINPETGQRVRGISAAAAAAGEVMLDRARKASAMRDERRRRKRLKPPPLGSSSNDDEQRSEATTTVDNYSRLQFLAKNCPTAPVRVPQPKAPPPSSSKHKPVTPTLKPAPKAMSPTSTKALLASKPFRKSVSSKSSNPSSPSPASAKAIRARVHASMSLNMLLSLSPSAEDLDGKPSAATKAMLERGVAPQSSSSKTNQQPRFRHPFPNSLGGRRCALQASGQGGRGTSSDRTLLQASYNSLALPPLKTGRERRSMKPIPAEDRRDARSDRAAKAIRCVLDQFKIGGMETQNSPDRPHKRRLTEISFLHGIRSSAENANEHVSQNDMITGAPPPQERDIDPLLALNVLRAVGLIKNSYLQVDSENVAFGKQLNPSLFDHAEKGAMTGEDGNTTRKALKKLRNMHNTFTTSKRTFTEAFDDKVTSGFSTRGIDNPSPEPANTPASSSFATVPSNGDENEDSKPSATVVSIRGGGEVRKKGLKEGKGGQAPSQKNRNSGAASNSGDGSRREQAAHENMQSPRSNLAPNMPMAPQGAPVRPGMGWEVMGYNGHHPNANPNGRMQGQIQSPEHFHHHSTANAIQLAHHLRHATSTMSRPQQHGRHAGGDMADYIGGLHSQRTSGYDWSTIGAASHSQLAALGMHPHRAAIMNFAVQDRTRALIAHEQQNAAAAAHAAHRQNLSPQAVNFLVAGGKPGYPPNSPPFPHLAGPATALLNSPTALVGHPGMQQVPPPTHVQSAGRVPPPQEQRTVQQKTDPPTKKESKAPKDSKLESTVSSQLEEPPQSKKALPSSVAGKKRAAPSDEKARKRKLSARKTKLSEKRDPNNGESQTGNATASAKKSLSTPIVRPIDESTKDDKKKGVDAPSQNMTAVKAASREDEQGGPCPNKDGSNNAAAKVEKPSPRSSNSGQPAIRSSSGEKAQKPIVKESKNKVARNDVKAREAKEDMEIDSAFQTQSDNPGGLQFFVPPAPPVLPAEAASLVLAARTHDAIELLDTAGSSCDAAVLIDYLIAVGSAVPIPKALVAQPLKERLASIVIKNNPIGTFPTNSREAMVASVLLWLWRSHEDSFQMAFAKNGRIDVDQVCKWLISAAVDKAAGAISKEVGDSTSRAGSQLTVALVAVRSKGGTAQKSEAPPDTEKLSLTSTKLDLLTASIVGRELMAGISVDSLANSLLPHFDELLNYLDDTRKYVLYSKSQERVFLANLISRKATMSLPFSHAYVSSMVRAGEAVGHGEIFEIVQNEEVQVATNIPYDIFNDESGAWEDPCRPIPEGFTQGLTGDDLMRRAHARAMIQKSLKKLQDRHGIKGGTSHPGPYVDPPNPASGATSDSSKTYNTGASTTPRGSFKRRSFSEPPVQAGTGSAPATSWSLYDPKHYSSPWLWKAEAAENSPYGSHGKDQRPRSLSVSQGTGKAGGKSGRGKLARSMSILEPTKPDKDDGMRQSTTEIAWKDVANIFQEVELPGSAATQKEKEAKTALRQKTIFAPFVRQVELTFNDVDSESDDEEDLRDETVLGRHQLVLDRMKEKLAVVFESRKKTQERRKK